MDGEAYADGVVEGGEDVAYSDTFGWDGGAGEQWQGRRGEPQNEGSEMADTSGIRGASGGADPRSVETSGIRETGSIDGQGKDGESGWWTVEPDIRRVAHGVPRRVDRLRGLGNAVVPQVAEWVGRRIVAGLGR